MKKVSKWTMHVAEALPDTVRIRAGNKWVANCVKSHAQKIAAVPQLIDALELALVDLQLLDNPELADDEERPSISRVKAALKKAGIKAK